MVTVNNREIFTFLIWNGAVITSLEISRFDHYATLCELLPSAIPTLALCLKTWLSGGYNQELHEYGDGIIQCYF